MKYSSVGLYAREPLSPQVPAFNAHRLDCIESISWVAHQMLTPLAIIDGAAQRLIRSDNKASVDLTERGQRIRAAAQELVILAHGLLDQVRAGMELSGQPWIRFSLSEVLQTATNRIRSLHPERVILTNISQTAEILDGRPELLGQMIAILLDNAAKYSAPDRAIKVNAFRSARTIVVSVSDEGIGIPSAEIEKIFHPFYRAGNTEPQNGIGLGLSLARRIAQRQGGDISVQSAIGSGSIFSITLPQAQMASSALEYLTPERKAS